MKNLFILILILISAFSFGQKDKKIKGRYTLNLVKVDSKTNNGTVDSGNSYKDSLININWTYESSRIAFNLKNESDQTIKVLWNDAAIIDINGNTKRTFHNGIKYIDREKEQSPTSIYKGSSLSDLLSPIENVSFISGKYGGWQIAPILKTKYNLLAEEFYDPELVDKKIKVALPLIINEKLAEYLFEFDILFIEKKKK